MYCCEFVTRQEGRRPSALSTATMYLEPYLTWAWSSLVLQHIYMMLLSGGY